MKAKLTPAVVGFFVLGALTLAIVALLSFGSTNFFSKPQRFVVYFDESVHGLELGSPVKLRGVRVGRVANINVRYNSQQRKSVVAVTCEFTKNVIIDNKGAPIDITDREELQTLIDQGLRAQLDLQGLATGLLYVQLDFMDPLRFPVESRSIEVKYAVVPTTANRKLTDLDTKRLADEVSKAANSVTTFINSPEAKGTFANLNTTLTELRGMVASIETQANTAGPELTKALQSAQTTFQTFNAAAASARHLLDSSGGVSSEAVETLRQLSEAADAVQRLADFLERNPNALLAGRRRPD